MCRSGIAVALAGFAGLVLVPSISLAQYPGSAGDLNTGGFGASTSANSGSGSSSASTSASASGDVTSDGYDDGSASSSVAGSGSPESGHDSDGLDGFDERTAAPLLPKKAARKRALIRQFRFEFAKTLTIETANKHPFRVLSADVYLDQFSNELNAGIEQQADLNSLGRDLSLVRDAVDDRLGEVIASYGGKVTRRGFFSKTPSAGGSVTALRAEIQKLRLKHELLTFGEYSLQAMGYYAR